VSARDPNPGTRNATLFGPQCLDPHSIFLTGPHRHAELGAGITRLMEIDNVVERFRSHALK
jgi:hypothetical protein